MLRTTFRSQGRGESDGSGSVSKMAPALAPGRGPYMTREAACCFLCHPERSEGSGAPARIASAPTSGYTKLSHGKAQKGGADLGKSQGARNWTARTNRA